MEKIATVLISRLKWGKVKVETSEKISIFCCPSIEMWTLIEILCLFGDSVLSDLLKARQTCLTQRTLKLTLDIFYQLNQHMQGFPSQKSNSAFLFDSSKVRKQIFGPTELKMIKLQDEL